ncbi:MAG: hypothetical protein IJ007_02370 [Oscillospiraceae bacterium]|nr:hypothetical protein [Oscillospiraceae bacterium]
MRYVYNLALHDNTSDGEENFDIGFFSSREKAQETAEKFLNETDGFKDGDFSGIITEKKLIGCEDGAKYDEVYVIYGYNVNENGDTIDIITSECLTENADVEGLFEKMKEEYVREYWGIDDYIIDECQWEEGI